MDRREYTAQVLSRLRRVTAKEREAIRAELDGHMEDRFEALRELGYDKREAEERTLAAMGDPAEVGRELNQQYTGWGWVIFGRIAKLATILMLLPLFLQVFGSTSSLAEYLKYRIDPDFSGRTLFLEYAASSTFLPESVQDKVPLLSGAEAVLPLDIRLQVGNDELRVFRVSVGETEDDTGRRFLAAEVLAVAYDRIPFGVVASRRLGEMTLTSQNRQCTAWCGDFFNASDWYLEIEGTVEIRPGDTYVTLSQDLYGEPFSLQIPLPEEVAP